MLTCQEIRQGNILKWPKNIEIFEEFYENVLRNAFFSSFYEL